jgi:hypothetical protein
MIGKKVLYQRRALGLSGRAPTFSIHIKAAAVIRIPKVKICRPEGLANASRVEL